MKVDGNAVDVGKLPTVARDDATVKRKLAKAHKMQVSISFHLDFNSFHEYSDAKKPLDVRMSIEVSSSLDESPTAFMKMRSRATSLSSARLLERVCREARRSAFMSSCGLLAPSHQAYSLLSPKDRSIKALRLRRVCLTSGCRDRMRNDGQLPPHGSHTCMQDDTQGESTPRAMGGSQQEMEEGAHGPRCPSQTQQGKFCVKIDAKNCSCMYAI